MKDLMCFFFFGWTCHPTTLSASGCCVTFYNPEHSSVSSVLPFCRKRLLSYSIPYKTISPTFLLTLSVLTLVPDDSARCRASISLAFCPIRIWPLTTVHHADSFLDISLFPAQFLELLNSLSWKSSLAGDYHLIHTGFLLNSSNNTHDSAK